MKKLVIILGIGTFLIVLIGLLAYYFSTNTTQNSNTFSLVKITPNNYSKDVNVSSEIRFEFSKTLSRKDSANTLETSPSVYLTKDIKDNEVVFTPSNSLKENSQYVFKLSNIQSIDGEQIEPITLIFTTGKDNSTRTLFIKSLPIQGDGYSIKFDDTINSFIVTIQKNPYDKYKQNTIDYLNSKGINTNSEKIKFEQLRYLQGSGAPPG